MIMMHMKKMSAKVLINRAAAGRCLCLDHSLGVTVAYRQDFSSLFRGSGYFA